MLTTKVGGLQADSVNVAGTSTIAGQTFISDTTSSVSSISGALRVNGGVGILGDIHVGGTIYGTVASAPSTDWSAIFNFTNTTNSSSTNTGAVVLAGGLGVAKTISATKVAVTGNTASISTATGSLVVTGGLGVSGTINSGPIVMEGGSGDASLVIKGGSANSVGVWMGESDYANNGGRVFYNSSNNLQFGLINGGTAYTPMILTPSGVAVPTAVASTSTNTGALTVSGGVGVNGAINSSTAKFVGGVASTTTSNGSLVVTGGAGISGDLRVGGTIYGTISGGGSGLDLTQAYHYTNTTDSTSTSTGALITDGGIGVTKGLNVGGVCTIENTTNVDIFGSANGSLYVKGGVEVLKDTLFRSVTPSTSNSTGAVVIMGGLGVFGRITCTSLSVLEQAYSWVPTGGIGGAVSVNYYIKAIGTLRYVSFPLYIANGDGSGFNYIAGPTYSAGDRPTTPQGCPVTVYKNNIGMVGYYYVNTDGASAFALDSGQYFGTDRNGWRGCVVIYDTR